MYPYLMQSYSNITDASFALVYNSESYVHKANLSIIYYYAIILE